MKKLLIVLPFTFIFYSCAIRQIPVNPSVYKTLTPSLNEVSAAELGVTLITNESGFNYNALVVEKPFKVAGGYAKKEIGKGEVFVNNAHIKSHDLYSNDSYKYFGIAMPKNGDNAEIYKTDAAGNIITTNKTREKLEFKTKSVPVKKKEYFKQEFIYNGKVNESIKFIYREYVDNYARPAFTQELQYDLSESSTVGFRGLRIDVMDASNTNIKYKIVNYFNN